MTGNAHADYGLSRAGILVRDSDVERALFVAAVLGGLPVAASIASAAAHVRAAARAEERRAATPEDAHGAGMIALVAEMMARPAAAARLHLAYLCGRRSAPLGALWSASSSVERTGGLSIPEVLSAIAGRAALLGADLRADVSAAEAIDALGVSGPDREAREALSEAIGPPAAAGLLVASLGSVHEPGFSVRLTLAGIDAANAARRAAGLPAISASPAGEEAGL